MDINKLSVEYLGKGRIITKIEAATIRASKIMLDNMLSDISFLNDNSRAWSHNEQDTIKMRRPVKWLN